MANPKIDKRDRQNIEAEIKALIPSYLPQWNPTSDDAGWGAAQAFSKMTEDLIKHLNQLPSKLFIDFLKHLDFKLHPAQPSIAPVTFFLTKGAKQNRLVPESTLLSDDKKVLFETKKAFTVTTAKLTSIYSTTTFDQIYKHFDDSKKYVPFSPFDGKSLQKHILYFGDDYLFNMKKGTGEKQYIRYTFPNIPNCRWEYYGEDKDGNSGWQQFYTKYRQYDKSPKYSSKKTTINGITTFWIRAVSDNANLSILRLNDIKIKTNSGIDSIFLNDIPKKIDSNNQITLPTTYDLLYIGAEEAFSKRGCVINLSTTPSSIPDSFSWEYFNGVSWKPLPFNSSSFTCPSDMSQTEINNEKNYWIRARKLIENGEIKINTPISIGKCSIKPKHIFSYNNLEFKKIINSYKNTIFTSLDEKNPSVYLGFDKAFGEGLISILFSLKKKYVDLNYYIDWYYYSSDGWKGFSVLDGTNGLTQSGLATFIAPNNQKEHKKFGEELFWIKMKIHGIKIADPSKHSFSKLTNNFFTNAMYVPSAPKTMLFSSSCKSKIKPLHPLLKNDEKNQNPFPRIDGIYLNTTYAEQSQHIASEIVGSSDGTGSQTFKLARTPIHNLKLWVKERLKPDDVFEFYPDKTKGFWVLWEEIESIHVASSSQRCFVVDRATGEIKFGDGNHGLIVPIGKNNIKAEYITGGGKKGNVKKEKIKKLLSSISTVNKVKNYLPAGGGADTQSIQDLIQKAPKVLKARDRAITVEDYEILTKEASTDIAKVKAFANIDNKGEFHTNWVSIVAVPFSDEYKPECSKELIKHLYTYLKERAPMMTHIQVISPLYAKLSTNIVIVTKKWDLIAMLKEKLHSKIVSFLHPLHGGLAHDGWEFGKLPCYSDFFALIESIEDIYYVKSLELTITVGDKTIKMDKDESPYLDVAMYILVCSGLHTITVEGE